MRVHDNRKGQGQSITWIVPKTNTKLIKQKQSHPPIEYFLHTHPFLSPPLVNRKNKKKTSNPKHQESRLQTLWVTEHPHVHGRLSNTWGFLFFKWKYYETKKNLNTNQYYETKMWINIFFVLQFFFFFLLICRTKNIKHILWQFYDWIFLFSLSPSCPPLKWWDDSKQKPLGWSHKRSTDFAVPRSRSHEWI